MCLEHKHTFATRSSPLPDQIDHVHRWRPVPSYVIFAIRYGTVHELPLNSQVSRFVFSFLRGICRLECNMLFPFIWFSCNALFVSSPSVPLEWSRNKSTSLPTCRKCICLAAMTPNRMCITRIDMCKYPFFFRGATFVFYVIPPGRHLSSSFAKLFFFFLGGSSQPSKLMPLPQYSNPSS